MKKFNLSELAELLHEPVIEDHSIYQVAVDSRNCVDRSLFFALPGDKVSGELFLEEAANNGAIAAIVSSTYVGEDYGMQLLKAKDPMEVLQTFAKLKVKKQSPLIIGVTGSVGKTTTKEYIATILGSSYKLSKTKNSYNGQIGLPLSILNAEPDSDVLVLEYGMNKQGEMQKLINIAEPHIAVITPISAVHIGYFSSENEIAKEKSVILHSKHLRLAIIHEKSQTYQAVSDIKGIKRIIYGQDACDYKMSVQKENVVITSNDGKKYQIDLPNIAPHQRENFLPAFLIAMNLRISLGEIQKRALSLQPFSHRFEFVKMKQALLIDDTYNASPYSVKMALNNLPKPKPGGKTLAVLGSMTELGDFSEKLHKEVAETAIECVDKLICYGELSKPLFDRFNRVKEARFCETKDELVQVIKRMTQCGDVVFIKGANSLKLWEVVEELKKTDPCAANLVIQGGVKSAGV